MRCYLKLQTKKSLKSALASMMEVQMKGEVSDRLMCRKYFKVVPTSGNFALIGLLNEFMHGKTINSINLCEIANSKYVMSGRQSILTGEG